MICPNCGKTYNGDFCPACGRVSPANPSDETALSAKAADGAPDSPVSQTGREDAPALKKAPRPSHWMRNAAILAAAAAILAAGAAVTARRYGGNWGFLLPANGVLSSGADGTETSYDELLPSGHYVVGVDIPAGLYTITAEKGEGRLFTALGVVDETLIAQGGPDTICGFEDVSLAVGDTLTATGMTIHVRGTATGTTSARSNTAVEPVTLAVLSGTEGSPTGDTTGSAAGSAGNTTGSTGNVTGAGGNTTGSTGSAAGSSAGSTGTTSPVPPPSATFRAGEDFSAGVYTVCVLRGDGLVVSGAETAGGIYAHMAETEENGAVKEFRNVNLSDGAELAVTGLDIRLIPSK